MKYKGYIGHVEYDDEAKIFHGEVVGLKDIITFQGKSVKELEDAFKDSINNYLLEFPEFSSCEEFLLCLTGRCEKIA